MSKLIQLKRKATTTTTSSSSNKKIKSLPSFTYWNQEFKLQQRVAYRDCPDSPWRGATIVNISADKIVTVNIHQEDSQYFHIEMNTPMPLLASIQFFELNNGRLVPSTQHFKPEQVWEIQGQGNCVIERVEQSSITLRNGDRTIVLRGSDILDKMQRLISSPDGAEVEPIRRDQTTEIKQELWRWYTEYKSTGDFVAVKDRAGDWYQGRIINLNERVGAVQVHYEGFDQSADEWVRAWDHVSIFYKEHFEPLKRKNAEPGDLQVKIRHRKFYKELNSVLDWWDMFDKCCMCNGFQHTYVTKANNQVYCHNCASKFCRKPNCYYEEYFPNSGYCLQHYEEEHKIQEEHENDTQMMEEAEQELNQEAKQELEEVKLTREERNALVKAMWQEELNTMPPIRQKRCFECGGFNYDVCSCAKQLFINKLTSDQIQEFKAKASKYQLCEVCRTSKCDNAWKVKEGKFICSDCNEFGICVKPDCFQIAPTAGPYCCDHTHCSTCNKLGIAMSHKGKAYCSSCNFPEEQQQDSTPATKTICKDRNCFIVTATTSGYCSIHSRCTECDKYDIHGELRAEGEDNNNKRYCTECWNERTSETALVKPTTTTSSSSSSEPKEDLNYGYICSRCTFDRYVKAYTAEGVYWSLCHSCYVAAIQKKTQFLKVIYENEDDQETKTATESLMEFREPSELMLNRFALIQVTTVYRVREVLYNHVLLEDIDSKRFSTQPMAPLVTCNHVNLKSDFKEKIFQSRTQIVNFMLSLSNDLFMICWTKRLDLTELKKKSNGDPEAFGTLAMNGHETRTVIARLWPRKTQSPMPFGQTLIEYVWDMDEDQQVDCFSPEPRLVNNEGIQWILHDGIKYVAR